MQDRRQSDRRKTYFGGQVIFHRRQSTLDCIVRNLGDGGARLSFAKSPPLPDTFDVAVPSADITSAARVTWRNGAEVGISFEERGSVSKVVPLALARRLHALEKDNARLRERVQQLSGA